MMKITCFWVLVTIARTIAENGEVACCPPGNFLSTKKVKDKAVCYTLGSNETTPTSIKCELGYIILKYTSFVFKDGRVFIEKYNDNPGNIDVTDRYCVQHMANIHGNITLKHGQVCLAHPDADINSYTMIISVVFLTVTVIIYSTLRELRDLYGISFINLCGSLAIGLSISVVIRLTYYVADDKIQCAARGFFAYFFLLVSICWTTAISTQLLLGIRSPLPVADRVWKTFTWYALFAWGSPAVLTICMAIVNFHPGDHPKPNIGFDSCWFHDVERVQHWYWLYSVLAILMAVNISIFVYVSFLFCRNNFASSHISSLKYKFGLALKLFIAMGLFWIIEILATIDTEKRLIWKILVNLTCLQGLWIFLAWVVFRKRVIKALYHRGWLACVSGPVEKYLANDDEVDDEIIEHTTVPMNDH